MQCLLLHVVSLKNWTDFENTDIKLDSMIIDNTQSRNDILNHSELLSGHGT